MRFGKCAVGGVTPTGCEVRLDRLGFLGTAQLI